MNKILNCTIDVSVHITVRKEAHRKEASLKRLTWVKEIFIFDKKSSDNTLNMCQNNGATVINVPNTPKIMNVLSHLFLYFKINVI